MTESEESAINLFALRRRWLWIAAFYLLTILLVYGALRDRQTAVQTNQWLGQTAVVAVYCLWIVWRQLPTNCRAGETAVLPAFGWGNRLTLLRGLLVSMMAGFLFIPWSAGWTGWLPAIFYTIADIADFLDGYAARKTNHATALGARLDMEFDGLGVLIVSLLAVWYGQLPWWYLLIGLARYFFVFGLWVRQQRQIPNRPLPPSAHRRIFAGFQMGFMSVALWPIVPAAGATITGVIFALATAVSFLRDWLVVVGWLDPFSARYQLRRQRLWRLFALYLPPLLRLIFTACMVLLAAQIDPAQWAALFTDWHLPFPVFLASFFVCLGVVAAVMMTAGAMGRAMSVAMMLPLGFDMTVRGPDWLNGLAIVCAVLIMLLGVGALALWKPEERFLYRRIGA